MKKSLELLEYKKSVLECGSSVILAGIHLWEARDSLGMLFKADLGLLDMAHRVWIERP